MVGTFDIFNCATRIVVMGVKVTPLPTTSSPSWRSKILPAQDLLAAGVLLTPAKGRTSPCATVRKRLVAPSSSNWQEHWSGLEYVERFVEPPHVQKLYLIPLPHQRWGNAPPWPICWTAWCSFWVKSRIFNQTSVKTTCRLQGYTSSCNPPLMIKGPGCVSFF